MTRVAYFDCFSGASGDMLLGALLDAGLELEAVRAELAKLPVTGYELSAERVVRQGISGTQFTVHDLAQAQPVRNMTLIRALLQDADLPGEVAARSLEVFERLAVAEAQVHGVTMDEIHFHEVGAVDSLVDIVGFFVGLEQLGIDAVYSSGLPLGSGTVRTAHGLLPVPAPATLALLAAKSAPIVPFDARAELVTPTGAALLSTAATFEQPRMRVEAVGYGFGRKEFAWPNLLRVWIGAREATAPPGGHGPHDHTGHEHAQQERRHAPIEPEHGHEHGHEHEHEHPHDDAHDHEHPHPHDHGHAHPHDHTH
jgi:hypothetical protein